MLKKRSKTAGFTLIELLVVISIIGLLSSIVLASFKSAHETAQNTKVLADVHEVQLALQVYFNDHGGYPACATGSTSCCIGTLNGGTCSYLNSDNSISVITGLISPTFAISKDISNNNLASGVYFNTSSLSQNLLYTCKNTVTINKLPLCQAGSASLTYVLGKTQTSVPPNESSLVTSTGTATTTTKIPDVIGCTDPSASPATYNPRATIDTNPTSCRYIATGCKNVLASNNNPDPNVASDPLSCIFPNSVQHVCGDPQASDYVADTGSGAVVSDGKCTYNIYGCTDRTAYNYSPKATVDDGSCKWDGGTILGCTKIHARNYNPLANTDDFSCILKGGCTYLDDSSYDPTADYYVAGSCATIQVSQCNDTSSGANTCSTGGTSGGISGTYQMDVSGYGHTYTLTSSDGVHFSGTGTNLYGGETITGSINGSNITFTSTYTDITYGFSGSGTGSNGSYTGTAEDTSGNPFTWSMTKQ